MRAVVSRVLSIVLIASGLSFVTSVPMANADASSGSISFTRNAVSPLTDQPYLKILNRDNNNTFEFAGNFTVESWVKFTRFDLFQQFIGQAVGGNESWSLQMMTGGSNQLRLTGKYGDINSTYNFVANRWYHIALVREGYGN